MLAQTSRKLRGGASPIITAPPVGGHGKAFAAGSGDAVGPDIRTLTADDAESSEEQSR